MLNNFEQPLNIGSSYEPALVQFSAFHTTLVKLLQSLKAEFPILVTLSGIITLVNLQQL